MNRIRFENRQNNIDFNFISIQQIFEIIFFRLSVKYIATIAPFNTEFKRFDS